MVFLYIILAIVAYLIGSISSAVWIGKRYYGVDIREHGSGNAGATNMLRVLGRKAAIPVFIIDFLKGYAAVMLAHFAADSDESLFILKLVLAVFSVVGHMFPIYSKFKGGKGVATIAGSLLAIAPLALLMSFVVFFIVFAITKYVSLGSMIAGFMFPWFILLLEGKFDMKFIFGVVVALLLFITHRKNLKRIIQGVESKIYLKVPKKSQ